MPNYEVAQGPKQNPMLGLIGFVLLLVIGGAAYAVSAPVTNYLTRTSLYVGGRPFLPLQFPATWVSPIPQLVVTFVIGMAVFVLVMIVLFIFMKPETVKDETSVSLAEIRKDAAARKRR